MNWDRVSGAWKQLRGSVRQTFDRITDVDYDWIAGQKDKFVGKLQERYGYTKDVAEEKLSDWLKSAGQAIERAGEKV
jgi:uncharacterized protein YjbJ (UPF0337 family)